MRNSILISALIFAVVSGCHRYVRGELNYIQHPELEDASIYDKRDYVCGKPLGRIEKIRVDKIDCSELAALAVADLIAEARAKGGDGVRDVQFRGHYRFSPTVFCRHSLKGANKIRVVGFAYKKCQEGTH